MEKSADIRSTPRYIPAIKFDVEMKKSHFNQFTLPSFVAKRLSMVKNSVNRPLEIRTCSGVKSVMNFKRQKHRFGGWRAVRKDWKLMLKKLPIKKGDWLRFRVRAITPSRVKVKLCSRRIHKQRKHEVRGGGKGNGGGKGKGTGVSG